MNEADVPTERAQAREDTRVPQADVDEIRTHAVIKARRAKGRQRLAG